MTTIDSMNPVETPRKRSGLNIALWVVQVLLALLFLWGGAMKFVMTPEQMQQGPVHLPLMFLRFIGVCEVLGGLGLLLPGLLGIRPILTAWAAAGLVIIMIGAVVVTLQGAGEGGAGMAAFPAVTGILAAFVAYGRWRLAPLASRR